MNVDKEIGEIRAAVKTLSDGKWNKKDISAVVSLLGGVAGLASAAYLVLQGAGVL